VRGLMAGRVYGPTGGAGRYLRTVRVPVTWA